MYWLERGFPDIEIEMKLGVGGGAMVRFRGDGFAGFIPHGGGV